MKKIKNLHLVAYMALLLFLAAMTSIGWYKLPIFSAKYLGGGLSAFFSGGFVTGDVGRLVSSIIFIVGTICFVVFLVLFIVRCVKKDKKDHIALSVIFLVITYIVLTFLFFIYLGSFDANNVSVINVALKDSFNALIKPAQDTMQSLIHGMTISATVLMIIFIVCEIMAYFKALRLVEKEVEPQEEVEVLTEDDMRNIIREELSAVYGKTPVTEEPVEEAEPEVVPAAVVVEEEPVVEETVAEEVIEEPVEEVVEEPVEEVVEEVVEETVEEVVEEPVAEEPVAEEVIEEPVVEEPVEEPVVEEPVEEVTPVIEEPVVEEVFERQEATKPIDVNGNGRISFYERIVAVDQDLLDVYNEIKNEILSYGVKSRISSTGDTFRLHRVTYMKMIFSGKKVKLYMKLNPNDFKDTKIPYNDVSGKKAYEEIPFVFKVKSGLSLRRAKALIKQMMDENGIIQESEPKHVKYAENLIKDIKEGRAEG